MIKLNIALPFPNLEKWARFLETILLLYHDWKVRNHSGEGRENALLNSYILIIESQNGFRQKQATKTIDLVCLTPAVGYKQLKSERPRSILLCSGTLNPMDKLAVEFESEFPKQLTTGHVIDSKEQLKALIIRSFDDGFPLNFSYGQRDDDGLIHRLGEYIFKLAQVVPKGMVIFFPSYFLMETFIKGWSAKGIITKINNIKKVFQEERAAKKFKDTFNNFSSSYRNGAIMFAVCGGKMSEGINLTDEMARMVVIVGIPFPNSKDPKVEGKRNYLNKISNASNKENSFNGTDWYKQTAIRSINQAIGRVIRHRYDYGAILLLDERYFERSYKEDISGWVAERIEYLQTTGESISPLKLFYSNASMHCSVYNASRIVDEKKASKDMMSRAQTTLQDSFKMSSLKVMERNYISTNKDKELKRRNPNLTEEVIKAIEKPDNSSTEVQQILDSLPIQKITEEQTKMDVRDFLSSLDINQSQSQDGGESLTFIPNVTNRLNFDMDVLCTPAEYSSLECLICYKKKQSFLTSKCGHIACSNCWEIQIQNVLECPMCKSRVRGKTLYTIKSK